MCHVSRERESFGEVLSFSNEMRLLPFKVSELLISCHYLVLTEFNDHGGYGTRHHEVAADIKLYKFVPVSRTPSHGLFSLNRLTFNRQICNPLSKQIH